MSTSATPLPQNPAHYRNVVLLGPSGSGKSTLIQALVNASAASTGAPYEAPEYSRTTELTHVTVNVDEYLITLLDTPGHPDFIGAVRAGLRAADAALFVVSAIHGIDQATALLWQECEVLGLPRAIVATHSDHASADVNEVAAIVSRLFTGNSHVLAQPVLDDSEQLAAIINLPDLSIRDYTSTPPRRLEPDEEHITLTADLRGGLLESVIAEADDEDLLEQFLEGDDYALEQVTTALEHAVARSHFHPILPVGMSPYGYVGGCEVLELIIRAFPSPAERELPSITTPEGLPTELITADPNGPLCAEVVATRTDRFTGSRATVRVFSGTLNPSESVHISGHVTANGAASDHNEDEHDGTLYVSFPHGDVPCTSAPAGAIITVANLSHAHPGDTLSHRSLPLLMEPWLMPESIHPVAVTTVSPAQADALIPALTRVCRDDPSLHLATDADSHHAVLWTLGEAHAQHVREILNKRHDLDTTTEPLRMTLRETVTAPVTAEGRIIEQSGGHGSYAACQIVLEPLPLGGGVEFSDEIVDGAIPRSFINSVEKGARGQLRHGVNGGFPITDVRIRLIDAKADATDCDEAAFSTAGAMAIREAIGAAALALLEPIASVRIEVADDFTDTVIADLTSKRGKITETTTVDGGRSVITAAVPEMNLAQLAIEMRALSHGTATIHREFTHFAPMPPQAAARARG